VAALGALSGDRHGGITEAVAQLFEQPVSRTLTPASDAAGGILPGFGHPLYPDGDPRARRLLELCPRGPVLTRARALAAEAWESAGVHPSLDFGLVTLCRSLRLPRHAPFVLFALGRTAGWIGHIQEQYAAGTLIRPRARYVGVPPGGGDRDLRA
jgi:citrate synthase